MSGRPELLVRNEMRLLPALEPESRDALIAAERARAWELIEGVSVTRSSAKHRSRQHAVKDWAYPLTMEAAQPVVTSS